jgi:hypothetical protein
MTDKQIEKIKKQIRSLRAKLSAEKRKHGWYDDSRGYRFIIPDLYLQIEDYKGALRYFNWFEKEFEMDSGFPDFNLAWTITLYKNKKHELAIKKLYTTAFSNTYLIDLILGNKPLRIDKSELISWESLDFAIEIEKYWKRMLSTDFVDWLKDVASYDDFKKNMADYIGLKKLIADEKIGKERERLLKEEDAFISRLTK